MSLCKRRILKLLLIIVLSISFFYLAIVAIYRPSHDRIWEFGQETLPQIIFTDNNQVTINGYRNFKWSDEGEATLNYETINFALDEINAVDVFISHFDDFEGLAHIFLSFGLSTGKHIVVSLETRREQGEEFSPLLGILRQFEIIYVVGSESDIVGVRTDIRGERVYLYPTKATPKQAIDLFKVIASDINNVYDKPRMYNTLTNNCTNELTRRVEEISDISFPYSWKTILPGYFDEILYELSIINTEAEFAEVKIQHLIDNTLVDRNDLTYSADLRAKH